MSIKKFLFFSFVQWLLLTFLKVGFFKYQFFSGTVGNYLYWISTAIIIAALVRRLGVLNFLEAILICVVWVFGNLLADAIITLQFTGTDMYKTPVYWIGFAVLLVSVLLFHKKRHIEIRKKHAAHH